MALDDLDPEAEVLVMPRYLAGPGGLDLQMAWPLPFEEGWLLHQPGDGDAVGVSPCQRVRLGFTPDPTGVHGPGGGTWQTHIHTDPFALAAWTMTFSGAVPLEILRDAHTEVLSLYLEGLHGERDWLTETGDTSASAGYLPLLTAGWSHTVDSDGKQTFRSPETSAFLRHWYSPRKPAALNPTWTFRADIPGEPLLWQATFTTGTPASVIAAVTTSLVEALPLARTVRELPAQSRTHVRYSPSLPAPPPAPRPLRIPPRPPAPPAGRSR
ncbi:DUF317 domain-containing protein [Streptomyces jumonjinensis]|uniref:DUF317 domain-containing protein n=1 Tax=Streptomyces jumonjinensis TaxID=1945 RepID=UPI0037B17523